ncbi:MAG: SRPBCC family protein [Calditrichota bacterium]
MHSFELKTVIAAKPSRVFAVITDPQFVTQWDYCAWVQNDRRTGGKVRKRDAEGRLFESEIVAYESPYRYGVLQPVLVDTEDEDEGRFSVRFEYAIDSHENQSVLTLTAAGFPSEELAAREKNSWGGYFLEKLKKVAEKE